MDTTAFLSTASDPAASPSGTAVGFSGRGPCCYVGRMVYRHAHKPAMIGTAIHHTPIANIKNVAHDAQRRSLLLDGCIKVYAVVCSCVYIYRPARIDVACVNIQREDKMFLGRAAVRCDHRVQKECT